MEVTDTISLIPIAQIVESPFNPRRTFGDAGLGELASDIKTNGILSPLLTRARLVDPLAAVDKMFDGFELVFGHRRFRAAQLAGLNAVPCMVRKMSDDEVRRAQISENLAREDVHPIEEAEGLQALIDAGDNADQLAAQFGKSRSYVYGRLKLLQACPKVRDACLAGAIGSDTALLIARLRTVKLQEKALGYIDGKNIDLKDGGVKSFRQIRELLAERFTLDLKKPMFDPADALLLPAAGPCGSCPKRCGNAPEYVDLANERSGYWGRPLEGNPDVCTDPDCYAAKKTAHLRNEAAALQSKGKTVIEGNAARNAISATGEIKGGFIALKDARKEVDMARFNARTNSKIVPPLVFTIQDPRTGKTVEAVKRAELVAAGAMKAEPKSAKGSPQSSREDDRKRREADEARKNAKAKAEVTARMLVLQEIRKAVQASERSVFDLQLIALTAWAGVGYSGKNLLPELWGKKDQHVMEKAIGSMAPADLTLFLFDCALIDDCAVSPYNLQKPQDDLLRAAKHYGIDVAAARGEAAAKTVATPSTAARAAKGAKGKAGKKADAPGFAAAGVDLVGDPIVSDQTVEAGSAGDEAKDEPADAGVARDPNTADMWEGAQA